MSIRRRIVEYSRGNNLNSRETDMRLKEGMY